MNKDDNNWSALLIHSQLSALMVAHWIYRHVSASVPHSAWALTVKNVNQVILTT